MAGPVVATEGEAVAVSSGSLPSVEDMARSCWVINVGFARQNQRASSENNNATQHVLKTGKRRSHAQIQCLMNCLVKGSNVRHNSIRPV